MRSRVLDVVEQGLADSLFAGAVVHVSRVTSEGCEVLVEAARGYAEVTPRRRPMTVDAVFDIASLTKVIATLPAVLRSVQEGRLEVDRPVLPGHGISVHHLLTHTSGLPAWKPFYLWRQGKADYRTRIEAETLVYEPGTRALYSDLGMILLGFVLEDIWQKPLEDIAREQAFGVLGMVDTGYHPAGKNVVATEVGNAIERTMCRDYATDAEIERFPWRAQTICGAVNDGNCHYGLSGVSGHAGLFSTVADVARYAQMWAAGGRGFLTPELVQLATTNHTAGLGLSRGLGWEMGVWAGETFLPHVFGHTGFTGTAVWVDPVSGLVVVSLTNRLHPTPSDLAVWRRNLHAAVFSEEDY
ncbi:beta-lactamase family protein [Tumebacillus sp. ITR2]|uniref:Beta-lactamase family protein n=1 Tax=Tumebacillus amylolyticus TaxID=2801339 RepID=A0ABS1JEF4_9BACL|nr:serine hydrolase domain-containing protein [Tumebacillus amylolyticus]MBL0388623.1 beta-lactamase family protein [Tumebacillus amylolyticus]